MYGNPGDYAFGRAGLDAIITQLLNQMDGTGPPPMAKDKISQIQTSQKYFIHFPHLTQNAIHLFFRTKFAVLSLLGRLQTC